MTPYYDDGTCTIYHGDCREVLADLPTPALVIADPPYGVKQETIRTRPNRRPRPTPHSTMATAPRFRDWPTIAGDAQPFDPTWLLQFPRVVLWGANHYADRLPPSPSWLVWDKRNGRGINSRADCEMAWTNLGGPARLYHHLWNGLCRDSEQGAPLHPTQKPVSLMAWIIANWTQPGDLILDPYMGSGPILRAAKDLGRRAIGIEIEEGYCEVAARRLGQEVLAL